jgi:Prokaryotic Cytochrome C oxidase subunit IV
VTDVTTIDPDVRNHAELFRSAATTVWCFLIAATVVSWALGTGHRFVADHTAASTVILVVAFVKIRFVGLYFMELKDAPVPLRLVLEAWCLVVCGLTVGFFLVGCR